MLKIFTTQRRSIYLILAISVILNAILWLLSWFIFPREATTAILHYNSLIGIDFIGAGQHITALPLAAAILGLVNGLLGVAIERADKRAAWLLWSAIPILQIIFIGAFYFIWHINR